MPDVGILNLQIHDNSSTAAEGLGRLAAKLEAVKHAASGIHLGSVAAGLKRMNDELKNIQPSAIFKLKQLADVLERIGNISGNVGGIRISFGGGAKGQSAESIAESMRQARETASQAASGFEEIGSRIQQDTEQSNDFYNSINRVNEIIQQTGWSAQSTAEQFAGMFKAWNGFRMSNSLNAGQGPLGLGDGTGGSGAQWTYWKEGAIEVEGTVSDAMDAVQLGAGEAVLRLTGVVEETANVASGFENVQSSVQSTTNDLNGAARAAELMTQRINASRKMFANSSDLVKEYVASLMGMSKEQLFPPNAAAQVNEFGSAMQRAAGGARTLQNDLRRDYGQQMVEDLVNASSKADLLKMRIDALKASLAQKINNNIGNDPEQIALAVAKIQSLQAEYDKLTSNTSEAESATRSFGASLAELMFGTEGLKGAFKRMFPTLTSLFGRFRQLAKYRMLRAVISHISKGFSEGVKNVYEYSKAVGTSFAPSMDSAASTLAQFKNSIGAAAAPLISALIPLLNQVVSVVITAVNWLNQFFALLRGQTSWTRALPQTTEAFNKQAKAAGGAGKAMKDLLADWDELNIIQSESGGGGGGGGGGATEDYLNMFEEVHEFSQSVKDVLDFIDDHMGGILGLAEQIGLAILGWKISNAFSGLIGTLGKLLAGSMLVVIGVKLSYGSGFEAGKKGFFDTKDIIGSIGGGIAAGLGGKFIATTLFGAPAGMLGFVSGVTIAVVATIAGYIQGTREAFLDSLWGNKELSPEELQAFVDNMYKFNIVAEIQIIGASVTGLQNAKIDLDKAVVELGHTVRGVELDIESYDTLATKIQNVTDAAVTYYNEQLRHEKVLIEFGLSDNYELALTPAASTLQNIGKNTARIMAEAQREGWDDEKEKLIKFYADYLNDVTTGAELRRKEISFRTTSSAAFANLTRGSFMAVLDEQQKRNDEFIATVKEAKIAQAEGYEYNAAQLEQMINSGYDIGENGEVIPFDFVKKLSLVGARDTYIGLAIQARRDADEAGAEKLAESFEYQRAEVTDAIRRVYGGEKDFEKKMLNVGKTFAWNTATADEIGLYYYEELTKYDPAIKKAMELYGLHAQDIIDDDLMKALFEQAYDLGGVEGVLKFGTALNLDVSDVIKFTNWDDLTGKAHIEYIKALEEVFGADEVSEALGIDVNALITQSDFAAQWESFGIEVPLELVPQIAEGAEITETFTAQAYVDIDDLKWDFDSLLDSATANMNDYYAAVRHDDKLRAIVPGIPDPLNMLNNNPGGFGSGNTSEENSDEMAAKIANALAPLFGNQTNSQDTTNMLLRQLLMKEFKAVVTPSAQAGFQNLASEAMMELVQGFGR